MAQIRQRLHQDMQGVVAGAEAASDWKYYVRLYPWAALALAFGGGFLVVPRKRRSVSKTAEKAADAAIAKVTGAMDAVESSVKHVEPETKKKGLLALAIGVVSPLVVRAAQSYALSYVENWIAQQHAAASDFGPHGPPPAGPTQAGGTRRPGT